MKIEELKSNKSFMKDNKVTLQMIEYIDKFLYSLGEIYTIAYINMHSIFIETQGNQKNSNLVIVNKGFGKTTFLKAVAENNKKFVQVLPEKMYESFLSRENREYFNNKILVHYDLIQGIFGLDKKQKEQILGFWTSLLSDGRYHRQNSTVLKDIKCLVCFGMAKESYIQHKRSLFESTFNDRLTIITKEVDFEEKKEVYKYRVTAKSKKTQEKFVIKLITRKRKVHLDVHKFGELLMPYAMELDKFDIMTSTRAQDYIYNFLLCNAFVNGRSEVNENDIKMYDFFHAYHIDHRDIDSYNEIAHLIDKNPEITYDEMSRITKKSRKTVGRYARMYKNKIEDDMRKEFVSGMIEDEQDEDDDEIENDTTDYEDEA